MLQTACNSSHGTVLLYDMVCSITIKKKKKKAAIYVLFQLSIKIQVEMLSWPSEHVEMKLKRKSSE